MIGVIDIGTNSVLLLIAESGVRVLRDEARITRLGEGLHKNKRFLPQAKERTLVALEEYHSLCKRHKVERVICVGTAAFRKAEDGPGFITEIAERFGWETRILSGDDEARLSYLSVERDFGDRHTNLVALDIGGGSTEIISREKGTSLDLGTVVLTERFLRHDPPTSQEIVKMSRIIERVVAGGSTTGGPPPPRSGASSAGGWRRDRTRHHGPALIALAGTATTLSSVNQKMAKWDPEKIQGSTITLKELDSMISLFRRTKNEERKTIIGMVPGREDTLLAGSLILKSVMEKLKVTRVIVSDRGIRFGVIYERFVDFSK